DYRRRLRASEEAARHRPSQTAEVASALERMRPGDVVVVPGGKSGGRAAVLSIAKRRRGDVRLRAITPERRTLSLGPRDFPAPPRPIAHIDLPTPYVPNNANFQRQVASALIAARLRGDGRAH